MTTAQGPKVTIRIPILMVYLILLAIEIQESKCLRLGGELGLCFRTRRGVVKFDIAQLISTILAAADGRSIFLATDGRARRKGGLVDRFKREIAKVVHIVDITDEYKDGEASSMLLSELEQQICSLSKLHIGSSMSSWIGKSFAANFHQMTNRSDQHFGLKEAIQE